jgi:hypothetical protein
MSTSKKREVLNVNSNLVVEKTALAENVLDQLNSYKETYLQEIKEDATIEEIVQSIHTADSKGLLDIKHQKNKTKMLETFPSLNEDEVLDVLGYKSKTAVDSMVKQGIDINATLKSSGLSIENFVLNEEFVLNTKVEGRIKNMATLYCTNDTQKELRNLAMKLSKLVKDALKTDLLAPNRLGVVAENIIDINTGEIKHRYIMNR